MADPEHIEGWADITALGSMLVNSPGASARHIADVKTKNGIVPLYERPAPFHEFVARVRDQWFSISMIASVARLSDAVVQGQTADAADAADAADTAEGAP